VSFVTHLRCPRCGQRYSADEAHNLCACGTPLLVDYDLAALRRLTPADLWPASMGMWRYGPLLPVKDPANIVTLGEGGTPILRAPHAGKAVGIGDLWLKDEGLNPTGSFKARGAAAGVSKAKELGITTVAMPTAGNAGGAWAAYGARAGIQVHIAMPQDAPDINKQEVRRYGGHLTLVDGLISDAGRLIAAEAKAQGWFDVATLKEPYRIEGKKTMGLELAEAWGWATLPDVIVYPAGGGVGIIGIWKAITELHAIGWTDAPMPRFVVVQAAGCAPLVKAWDEGKDVSEFWPGAETVASGLRVPKALGDFLVLQALRESSGAAIAIPDAEILRFGALLAETEGLWAAPEGAATLAAAAELRGRGWIRDGESVVLINTGSGLKYPAV